MPRKVFDMSNPFQTSTISFPSSTFTFSFPVPKPCTHTVVPGGDVVLTLKCPNVPFALWDGTIPPAKSDAPPAPVTFNVSSHHLKLASPVFKAALTGGWAEGVATKEGHYKIDAEDWDAEALRIVLYVIHGRNRHVPPTVTLEMLCKIAVIVDYYQLCEALRFPCLIWVDNLRSSLPQAYDRDLILWLCIAWVFENEEIFGIVTKVAINHSTEEIRGLCLPIPERVMDKFRVSELAFVLIMTLDSQDQHSEKCSAHLSP